jgi:hypothetical protein
MGERITVGFAILAQKQYPSALVRYWAVVRAEVFQSSFVLYLYNCFSIGQRFRADDFQIPQHRKALSLYDMNLNTLNIKAFIFISLLALGHISYSQETTFSFDNAPFTHQADDKYKKIYDTTFYLINSEPSDKNYENYYLLACSMWELEKLEEAKKIFLTIVNSTKAFYQDTYYHSSDVPGDTTKNIYGYGSFTSNYKNYASLYLTKIYIEQKKFDSAYSYLNDAVKKFKVTYSCGTGDNWQQENYRFLYGLCYEGEKKEKELLDLLLPNSFDWQNQTLIRAIKRNYSKTEIKKHLDKAIQSIVIKVDKKVSSSFEITNYGKKNEKQKEIKYYSGTGKMNLFGKIIDLPSPELKNRERLTRQYYVTFFRESDFYEALTM